MLVTSSKSIDRSQRHRRPADQCLWWYHRRKSDIVCEISKVPPQLAELGYCYFHMLRVWPTVPQLLFYSSIVKWKAFFFSLFRESGYSTCIHRTQKVGQLLENELLVLEIAENEIDTSSALSEKRRHSSECLAHSSDYPWDHNT